MLKGKLIGLSLLTAGLLPWGAASAIELAPLVPAECKKLLWGKLGEVCDFSIRAETPEAVEEIVVVPNYITVLISGRQSVLELQEAYDLPQEAVAELNELADSGRDIKIMFFLAQSEDHFSLPFRIVKLNDEQYDTLAENDWITLVAEPDQGIGKSFKLYFKPMFNYEIIKKAKALKTFFSFLSDGEVPPLGASCERVITPGLKNPWERCLLVVNTGEGFFPTPIKTLLISSRWGAEAVAADLDLAPEMLEEINADLESYGSVRLLSFEVNKEAGVEASDDDTSFRLVKLNKEQWDVFSDYQPAINNDFFKGFQVNLDQPTLFQPIKLINKALLVRTALFETGGA